MVTSEMKGNVLTITCDWTSDGSGNASEALGDYTSFRLLSVQTIPGTGGAVPTDGYSVELVNAVTGLDVLVGECSGNRSASASDETIYSTVACLNITAGMTVVVSGAGTYNAGSVVLELARI